MWAPLDESARKYCSAMDVLTRVDKENLPEVDVDRIIMAVTNRIETYCDRVFIPVPAIEPDPEEDQATEEREFLGTGSKYLLIDDLLILSSMTIDDEAGDTADFRLMPFGKTPTTWLEYESGAVWTAGAEVALTGVWGYALTCPWEIWDAAVMWCVRALERAKQAYQDASAIPELGQLVYAKAIPAEIRETLERYRRRPL